MQLGKSRTSSLPLLPQHRSQPAPQPLIKALQHGGRLAEAEVALPASQVGREILHHPRKTHPTRAARQFPHSCLEALQRLRRNTPLRLPLAREAKAQELALRRPSHGALLSIDLELQSPRDVGREAPHHSPSRPFAAHVDITVIRVAHEAVAASLQLL